MAQMLLEAAATGCGAPGAELGGMWRIWRAWAPRGVMSEAGVGRWHVEMAHRTRFPRRRHYWTMCTQPSNFGAGE